MHLELVVPALFAVQGVPSLPALELLLARGRRSGSEPRSLEDWLGGAFGLGRGSLPAGALTLLGCGQDAGSDFWLRADPVHLRAERDRLLLVPGQALELAAEEAAELAAALNRHCAGQLELRVLRPDAWCARSAQEIALEARSPVELAGAGAAGRLPDKRWQLLLTEIQMALHAHPVNAARERRGALPANSLWLWGAGRAPAASGPWQSVSAQDPVALGLARAAGVRQRDPGAGADEWLAQAREDGRHLVVLDALRGARALGDGALARHAQALEARWFAPLLAALRSGRIGMVTLHVPDAAVSFETVRGDLRRFWRRARPLGAYRSSTG